MEGIFGKHDEMKGHMIKVELLTLELINLRRRNKWFSPFSPNMVLNSQCSYPHSIQSNFPLEPPGRCLLLRNLSNSLTQEKTKLINMG
jgi:hypothetical protein